ncbi:MAG: T9SS type A sorting domain-containing protein [Flavobacteriales bacterium]
MMKTVRIIAAAFAALFATTASAQIADGSVAPDFTTTDIDGNPVTLAEYMDAGKTVIMDVSATWCGPCWSYHQTGILEAFYALFGPEGADVATVLYVEGDASTTLEDIYGTGSNTWGDWTAGVDYPIIDDADIADAYEIAYYPTIYKICPDGLVYEVGQLSLEGLIEEALAGCDNAASGAFPYLSAYTGDAASCGDAEIRADVVNYGDMDVTSASFDLYVDGTMEGTYPWSGTIAAGATETIVLTSISTPGNTDIEIIMTEANGNALEQHTTGYIAPAADATTWWTVEILTDCWPGETTWEVRDASGATVQSGGPYTDAQTVITEEFGLPSTGCYSFLMNDAYGDGLNGSIWTSCGVDGNYTVSTAAGVIASNDGSVPFAQEVAGANATTVSVDEVAANASLNVYPNPTSDILNVNVSLVNAADLSLDVFNALGQRVMTKDFGTMMSGQVVHQLDLSGLESGVYTVNMTAGNEVSTVRVNVAR